MCNKCNKNCYTTVGFVNIAVISIYAFSTIQEP